MSSQAGRVLFVDLDGTMVDPAVGILTAYRGALTALGHVAPPASELGWVIGPPMRESMAQILGSSEQVEEGIRLYRESYSTGGLFEATPYPGVLEALGTLHKSARMFVCTSKAAVYARRIVAHFGFAPLYEDIYGAELDGRFDNKGDLIAHMLEREKLDPAQICMIGDRKHDVLAAKRHGIRSVGVLWGFGGQAELSEAGADVICATPGELVPAVEAAFRAT